MTDLVVRFKKPMNWAAPVNIYFWDTHPQGQNSHWPGMAMASEEDDWFVFRFTGVVAARLVFNDGQQQTQDLQRDREGWFYEGQWYDENPQVSAPAEDFNHPDPDNAPPAQQSAASQAFPVADHLVPKDGVPDFREETIYFLITTRFYEGDSSTSFFCRDRIKFNSVTGEPEDPHWRGDFKGLIARLDYLRDLGFSAIWITPPVENRSGLDYHGYHAYDWTRIDPRLESFGATYQDLINEAHARGIKIIQDVVVNHSCQFGIRDQVWIDHLPIKYYVPQGKQPGEVNHGPYRGNLGNYAWAFRDDIDNPLAGRDLLLI